MAQWGEWLGTRGVIDKLLETKFALVITYLYQVVGLKVFVVPPLRPARVASCLWTELDLGNLFLG